MKGKWIANQGFVIIQNNTTIKPEKMGVLTTESFVIIQNNTTIKQTSR